MANYQNLKAVHNKDIDEGRGQHAERICGQRTGNTEANAKFEPLKQVQTKAQETVNMQTYLSLIVNK